MRTLTNNNIDQLSAEATQLLRQLIATPSFSREEAGTALLIESFFKERGVKVHRLENNIWAVNKFYDSSKPTILLNSHHDTVKPNKDYVNDPYNAFESGGKLFGLGSNDAGGCLVALAATFLHFYERSDMKYNLLFAASAEEEISGVNGVAALLPVIGAVNCAIVGEPTLMQMAVAEKGLMVIDCIAHGSSGHAAREEGDNAIYKAMNDIAWFRNFQFPAVSPFLGAVKMSVAMINAGTQHNVVPASCSFTVDVRINDCYTNEEILEVVRAHVQCTVTPRSTRLRSSSIGLGHPLVAAGSALGLETYGSATLSDKALMSFPALKIGPGDSARSHMADEYIYTEEIRQGLDIYIQLLNSIL